MMQRPRGTRDFLPEEMEHRRRIEGIMRSRARAWGYGEVSTPAFEELELFTLRSGESIVSEMYIFEDKGGRTLALRPELTAPVLRMYVNEGKTLPKPLRWFYVSNCFRYERPQKGRYREFWQFGAELIGADSPLADVEIIGLAQAILRDCGVRFELKVGHLGPMKALLRDLEAGVQHTVMGFLDKKNIEGLETFLGDIRRTDLLEPLTTLSACRSLGDLFDSVGEIPDRPRIERLFGLLDCAQIPYTMNFGIARGLDYYTGMVFEGFAENLGAENQVVGGGAYRLAQLFGGEEIGSTGFAIGFDRVMVSLGERAPEPEVSVGIAATDDCREYAFQVTGAFRESGVVTRTDLTDRGLGAQLSHLSRDADFAVILGKRELGAGRVTLKNLHTGEQQELSLAEAIAEVKEFGRR